MILGLSPRVLTLLLSGLLFCATALFPCATALAAEPTVAELTAAAKSGDEAARVTAIDQLAERGVKAAEAAPALLQLLADKSPLVRAHAVRAVGKVGAPAATAADPLAKALGDENEAVRRQAVGALAAIRPGPKVMIPLLTKLLEDSDAGVRMRVLHVIAEAGEPAVPGLIEALSQEKSAYWACVILRDMGPAGKAAVPKLRELIKDKRPDVRQEAILALGAMQDAALPAVGDIAGTLKDEHLRVVATFVLGQLGKLPDSAVETIKANAKSEDKSLSTASLWALARVNPKDKELLKQAVEKLLERLKDKDPLVRVVAARALAALPPSPDVTLPVFEKALSEADETTLQHALDALASLGPAAVPRLIDALKHEKVRVHIAYVLGQIGPAAAPAAEALAKHVADKDSRTAHEVILTLGKIGPGAKGAVPALIAALDHESPNAPAIAMTLGRIGPGAAAAKAKLVEALGDKDKTLSILSAWALAKIDPSSKETAAKAVSALVAGLSEEQPESRQTAAEALGALGALAKDATAALEKAKQDGNPGVRAAATEALRRIGGGGK